jgi:hypothetical protein
VKEDKERKEREICRKMNRKRQKDIERGQT